MTNEERAVVFWNADEIARSIAARFAIDGYHIGGQHGAIASTPAIATRVRSMIEASHHPVHHFVVEIEADGVASARQIMHGMMPGSISGIRWRLMDGDDAE